MPRHAAAGGQVADASMGAECLRLHAVAREQGDSHVCDQPRRGRSADLVVHHAQRRTVVGQAQHGGEEVPARGCIDPAGSQDQMNAATRGYRLVARQLAGPVVVVRSGGAGLGEGAIAFARIDIVGRVVHERDVVGGTPARECCRPIPVDLHRQVAFGGFGAVDRRVGGRIDDQLRAPGVEQAGQCVGPREVEFGAGRRTHFTEHGQAALQFPTHLPARPRQQDPHQSYSSASISRLPAASLADNDGCSMPQSIARAGSFQAMQRSADGR